MRDYHGYNRDTKYKFLVTAFTDGKRIAQPTHSTTDLVLWRKAKKSVPGACDNTPPKSVN
jgi:hypothetical protein